MQKRSPQPSARVPARKFQRLQIAPSLQQIHSEYGIGGHSFPLYWSDRLSESCSSLVPYIRSQQASTATDANSTCDPRAILPTIQSSCQHQQHQAENRVVSVFASHAEPPFQTRPAPVLPLPTHPMTSSSARSLSRGLQLQCLTEATRGSKRRRLFQCLCRRPIKIQRTAAAPTRIPIPPRTHLTPPLRPPHLHLPLHRARRREITRSEHQRPHQKHQTQHLHHVQRALRSRRKKPMLSRPGSGTTNMAFVLLATTLRKQVSRTTATLTHARVS